MILVDSSVWIDHFRAADDALNRVLLQGAVVQHRFVTAEVALGSIANRAQIVARLSALPQVEPVDEDRLLDFIRDSELAGCGIGLVDAHLLMACDLQHHQLWTRDKRLQAQAERLGWSYRHA